MDFNWDAIKQIAKATGQPILMGTRDEFTKKDMKQMSVEARKRHLCLSMGNHDRDPDEQDDEIYVMAKL